MNDYFYFYVEVFEIAVVFALLLLVFKTTGKNSPSNLADVKHTPYPLKLIAIGMVLAFFPTALLLSFCLLWPPVIFISQGIGAFMVTLGFLYLYRWNKKNTAIRKSGYVLAIIGSSIGLSVNFMIVFMGFLEGISFYYGLIMFTVATIIMAVASLVLSSYYTRFRGLGIVFVILSVIFLLIDLLIVTCRVDISSDSGVFDAISFILEDILTYEELKDPFVLGLMAVAVFGLRLAWAKPKAVIASENLKYNTVCVSTEAGSAFAPASSTDNEQILSKLKGYDNARLQKIVDNPKFHNAAVVEKARELLARREAWEQIKDLPDEELLEMTMADKGLYEPNIVEAASMELYQRDSQLLRGQFMALTPDTLSAIASGAAPAPEGIRLAAQKYLSKTTRP